MICDKMIPLTVEPENQGMYTRTEYISLTRLGKEFALDADERITSIDVMTARANGEIHDLIFYTNKNRQFGLHGDEIKKQKGFYLHQTVSFGKDHYLASIQGYIADKMCCHIPENSAHLRGIYFGFLRDFSSLLTKEIEERLDEALKILNQMERKEFIIQLKDASYEWPTKIRKYIKQYPYLIAIELNPDDSLAYCELADTMTDLEEKITLLNGVEMTQRQLYLKAIQLNPNDPSAYHMLAISMECSAEKITLPNGAEMTSRQLYLKAIELNSKESVVYYSLADMIRPGEKIKLPNGTEVTKQQLYLKYIELNPSLGHGYRDLADTMRPGEKVILSNGTEMTQQQVYLKHLEFDPKSSSTYFSLAINMHPGEKIKLPNGVEMTRQQLYLKAIELDPMDFLGYRSHWLGRET